MRRGILPRTIDDVELYDSKIALLLLCCLLLLAACLHLMAKL